MHPANNMHVITLYKEDILWTGGSEPARDLHRPDAAACTAWGKLYTNKGSLLPASTREHKGNTIIPTVNNGEGNMKHVILFASWIEDGKTATFWNYTKKN